MSFIHEVKQKVLGREEMTQAEALRLFSEPAAELCAAADEVRRHFCGDAFDVCTIINAKSGRCSEDCKFCAQSAHYDTECEQYALLSEEEIFTGAKYNADKGIFRYSLVTSGKTLSDSEVDSVCRAARRIISLLPVRVCGSFGLLSAAQFGRLRSAGITRIHNNLETSERNFPNMCTTHSFADKIAAINSAKKAGMTICSGGILGIGENARDRVDLAFSLKALGVGSVPINLLNPVKGTPHENIPPLASEEIRRIVAVFRFILPEAFIRLAGGRSLLEDKGRSCFLSGANAAISGDMLTTAGISIDADMKMIKELGFEVTAGDE